MWNFISWASYNLLIYMPNPFPNPNSKRSGGSSLQQYATTYPDICRSAFVHISVVLGSSLQWYVFPRP